MFRIECFVEDRFLAYVLTALATAKARNVTSVPVLNASINGDGEVTAKTSGEVTDMLRAWCSEKNLEQINAAQVRQFQMEIGRSPSGYSNTIYRAIQHGVLKKRKGNKAGYDVVPEKTK